MNKSGIIAKWIPMGIAVTLLSVMVYGIALQLHRLDAHLPQLQMAEDAAQDITRGIAPQAVLPKQNVDVAVSLSPFMIVYDDQGQILAASAVLDGKVPEIPKGVLDQAREKKEDRVTWEPKSGVRLATVVVRYVGDSPGFVLVGRSLREIEKTNATLFVEVVVGWAVSMVATFFAYYLFRR